MHQQTHPILQKLISEHLHGYQVNDPHIENLLLAINEHFEKCSATHQELELMKSAYNHLEKFAGVVAHDLRAPIRSISSLSLWIQEEAGDAIDSSIKEKLQMLISKSVQLEKLISGIMAYSTTGNVNQDKDYVNLRLLIDNSITLLGADEHLNISMESDFPDIYTASIPLQQVFLNLISNVMKHAGDNTSLRIRCGYSYNGLVFAILDNGPGIPANKISRLFEFKGHTDTGIGLAITKRIIEENGGAISVLSNQQGTCFSFDWPCEVLTKTETV